MMYIDEWGGLVPPTIKRNGDGNMTKKNLLRKYLLDNVDISELQRSYDASWLKGSEYSRTLAYNGMTSAVFTYDIQCKAIKFAGYVYEDSDRTWSTVQDVVSELVDEYINF